MLARKESEHPDVSALGAVMALLYSTYIVIYAIADPLLGKYIDSVFTATGGASKGGRINSAIRNVAGVQFTIISVTVLASTFIPRGSFSFDPRDLYGENLDKEVNDNDDSVGESLEASSSGKGKDYKNPIVVAQPGGRNSIVGTLGPVNSRGVGGY